MKQENKDVASGANRIPGAGKTACRLRTGGQAGQGQGGSHFPWQEMVAPVSQSSHLPPEQGLSAIHSRSCQGPSEE